MCTTELCICNLVGLTTRMSVALQRAILLGATSAATAMTALKQGRMAAPLSPCYPQIALLREPAQSC